MLTLSRNSDWIGIRLGEAIRVAMRKYDREILDQLNNGFTGEPIQFVGLGAHDFQVSFGVRIQNETKVVFSLRGNSYSWEEGPTDIPAWLLIGQIPERFELPTDFVLRMCLASGDYVEFHTDEQLYESTTIDFGERDGVQVMEIY